MPVQQWIATVKTCCEMNGGQYAPGPTDCVIGGRMPGDRAGHLRCAAQLEDVCAMHVGKRQLRARLAKWIGDNADTVVGGLAVKADASQHESRPARERTPACSGCPF